MNKRLYLGLLRSNNFMLFGALFLVLILLHALLPLPVSANGVPIDSIPPPITYTEGDSQYYTVVLDGEGEALVSLKLVLQDKNLSSVYFQIPGKDVRVLNVIQEVETITKTCQQSYTYDYAPTTKTVCEQYSDNLKCTEWDANLTCVKYEKECLKYAEQCDYYSDSSSSYYYSADHAVSDGGDYAGVTVTLPQPLSSDAVNKVTLIISYKVNDVAEKSLGVFSYDASTIKIDRDTNNVRVAVNVVDPFVLKGGTPTVDYRPSPSIGVLGSAAAEKLEASTDYRYNDASEYLEYAYGVVETAQALDPMETFHVKGKYATSRLALFKGRITVVSLLIIAVLIGIIFGVRAVVRSLSGRSSTPPARRVAPRVRAQQHAAFFALSPSRAPADPSQTALLVGVASFLSAALVFGTWYIAKFVIGNLYSWVYGDYYGSYGTLSSAVSMVVFLVATLLILVELAAPSFWVGIKQGWLPGVFTFLATLGWLILIIIVVVTLYIATSGGYSGPYY